MKNMKYTYDHMELWEADAWESRLSPVRQLVSWIGRNEEVGVSRSAPLPCGEDPNPKALPHYQLKTGSVDDPGVIQHWRQQGLNYRSLEMGGAFWAPMVPTGAEKDGEKLPVLMVMHHEDHGDPYWAMRTLAYYRDYNAYAARERVIVLFLVTDNKPDDERMYVNVLQEALVLFPCDPGRIYLDVSVTLAAGQKLGEIEGFAWTDVDGKPADPDAAVGHMGVIPVLNIARRWENRDSFTRESVMGDRVSDCAYDRDRLLHTATGRKMMEGIHFEYVYSDATHEQLVEYWAARGLRYGTHTTGCERWLTLLPESAAEAGEKLPVLLVLQEVSETNSHSAVAAFGAFYEYCQIAAGGEMMLLFFALESPDDNDLLADILVEAAERYPIDLSRAYITGHSHNGHFSTEFARRHPGLIAGVATLGNYPGFYAPEHSYDAVKVPDDKIEAMSNIDMPVINISGCCEMRNMFPLHSDARHMRSEQMTAGYAGTFACRAESWQRRLTAARCPHRTHEEIAATAQSPNKATRELGIPNEKSETLFADGVEHYIADIKNIDGKYHLRIVAIQNMPHMTTPFMQTLAWSYLRQFARDQQTGEIIEL